MAHQELPDDESLRLLREEAELLEETLAGCDRDMASAIQAHKGGISLRHDIFSDLQGLATQKQELAFKLGRLSAQIEQLEERIREQERQRAEDQRNRDTLAVLDNHLDWLDIEVRALPALSEDDPSHERER